MTAAWTVLAAGLITGLLFLKRPPAAVVKGFLWGFLPLLFAAIPDTVDYGLKTLGRGAMAMFFAGQLFALKMGISVGGGCAGWILGIFGYKANVAQTEHSLFGIKLAFAGAPLVAAVLVVILLHFYKLKKGWEQNETLVQRRADFVGNT